MTPELQKSLEIIRTWLAEVRVGPPGKNRFSHEEKKQLLAINRSIEQLKKTGVSIPDELLRLKLQLSAKDTADSSDLEHESKLAMLVELINSLRDLLSNAKIIRKSYKTVKTTYRTKKHFHIRLSDLIKAGLLNYESQFELQWLKNGEVFEGKLNSDGQICVRTQAGWVEFKSLSAAAVQIAGSSLNGWKHWWLVENNGKRVSLDEIRQKFIKRQL